MRITTLGEYGIRCLMVMARAEAGGPVSTRAIVQAEGLSRHYVEQIMLKLRRAGLVVSVRGVFGGYRLARLATEISALDVIRALEQDTMEIICKRHIGSVEGCAQSESCVVRSLCLRLRTVIEQVLAEATLAQLQECDGAAARLAAGRRS